MPYSQQHKKKSRKKILQSAYQLFANKGFENVSIDEVMVDAGLTRGAFYGHFSSKSELYEKSMLTAAMNSRLLAEKPEQVNEQDWVNHLISMYLSKEHVNMDEYACPMAFLTTDVAIREDAVRNTYTKIYSNMNKLMSRNIDSSSGNSSHIFAMTAMMIGGVAIARAVNDDKVRQDILQSCKDVAMNLLESAKK